MHRERRRLRITHKQRISAVALPKVGKRWEKGTIGVQGAKFEGAGHIEDEKSVERRADGAATIRNIISSSSDSRAEHRLPALASAIYTLKTTIYRIFVTKKQNETTIVPFHTIEFQ